MKLPNVKSKKPCQLLKKPITCCPLSIYYHQKRNRLHRHIVDRQEVDHVRQEAAQDQDDQRVENVRNEAEHVAVHEGNAPDPVQSGVLSQDPEASDQDQGKPIEFMGLTLRAN